jgi:hypothetical protein
MFYAGSDQSLAQFAEDSLAQMWDRSDLRRSFASDLEDRCLKRLLALPRLLRSGSLDAQLHSLRL